MMAGQPRRKSRWSRLSKSSFGRLSTFRSRSGNVHPPTSIPYGGAEPDQVQPTRYLSLVEPESELALRGFRRIGAVHQVVLRFEAEIAADGSRQGLLDRVGPAR